MGNASVAMVCHGKPHPSHAGFANAVGADIIIVESKSTKSILGLANEIAQGVNIEEYDILIAEGSRPLYAVFANSFINDTRLIYLCADHRFYEILNSEVPVDSLYALFKRISGDVGKPVVKFLCENQIDGVIAVSEFAAEFINLVVGEKTPIEVSHPYIQPKKYDLLYQVDPPLADNVAVTVGQSSRYKGVDQVVDAWPKVRQKYPEATLHIVGKGHPIAFEDTDGVIVHGFVEDLRDIFSEASLYVQPSRMDTFPVSVLEAFRAGLPAVVTNSTGSRSEVQEIDPEMVSNTDSGGIEQAVTRYFDMDVAERKKRSTVVRQQSKKFNEKTQKERFSSAFESITGEYE